ncbi:MAG: HAMP domain-containing protein [Deltaproteobacteria bacterium]|nr:HAMP domain-containing protein [Deltaproteobacteria bacterium]
MRLSTKIMSFVSLGIIALLAIDGYLSAHREIKLFDNDMEHDALLLGHAMKKLVADAWQVKGQDLTMELIGEANKDEHQIRIRWVWLDAPPGDPNEPRVSRAKLGPVVRGQEVSIKKMVAKGVGHRYTYVPIPIDNVRHGALELSESLFELMDYTHETVIRSFILAGLMLLASWLLLRVLSVKFVRGPLNQLVEKTRRIGAGELSGDLVLRGKDELSSLASAMNRMCRQLAKAQEAIRTETEARISALEQLRHTERLATLGRLSSGIAHELGTPLNVISGRAQLIVSEDLEKKEIAECSRIIRGQAERMTKLIQKFLDFARRRAPQKSPVDLRILAGQILEMLNSSAGKQGVSLELVKNSDIPRAAIDPSQIQQVLMNLVMNGIQAMPKGGHLELGFHLKRVRPPSQESGEKKEYLAIYVKDEGEGISQENMNLLFEPFFTTKEAGQGTGLGLSIAYGIAEEHGGWIDVESELGRGACFTVFLPVEVAQ